MMRPPRSAEIVGRLLRLGIGTERSGVERAVLQVFEGGAVEIVGAAARSGGDIADLGELRVVADALHFHFGDAFHGGNNWVRGPLEATLTVEMPSRETSVWEGRPPCREKLLPLSLWMPG